MAVKHFVSSDDRVGMSVDQTRHNKLAVEINNTRTVASYLGNVIGRYPWELIYSLGKI